MVRERQGISPSQLPDRIFDPSLGYPFTASMHHSGPSNIYLPWDGSRCRDRERTVRKARYVPMYLPDGTSVGTQVPTEVSTTSQHSILLRVLSARPQHSSCSAWGQLLVDFQVLAGSAVYRGHKGPLSHQWSSAYPHLFSDHSVSTAPSNLLGLAFAPTSSTGPP